MAQVDSINIAVNWQPHRASVAWEVRGKRVRHVPTPLGELDVGPIVEPSQLSLREIRDQFLAIEHGDQEGLLTFLRRTGQWDSGEKEFSLDYFWQEQDEVRAILTGQRIKGWKPGELLQCRLEEGEGGLDIRLRRLDVPSKGTAPAIQLEVNDTWSAIYLSLWVDLARKAKFRYCARTDCPDHRLGRVPFEMNRKDQTYCRQYCAHLASLRQRRASGRTVRQRKAKGR